MTSNTSRRRYELDWLRVLAILIVFVYHSSRFFNLGDWHVKNINTFVWVEIWNVFATRWMMPLFFIISGASLFYAIAKSGSWSRFYVDKFMRLMIPVLVASVTHSALQVYLERLTHGQFSGSFFSFLPEYFNGVYLGIGMPGATSKVEYPYEEGVKLVIESLAPLGEEYVEAVKKSFDQRWIDVYPTPGKHACQNSAVFRCHRC